jgi:DNA transformation protein
MVAGTGFKEFVADQLAGLRGVVFRRMFGGYGIYRGPVFFGILYKGRLYFKTTESTRPRYAAAGMKPFKPTAKQTLKTYYEVPADVIEDAEALVEWAQEASAGPVGKRRP